MIKISFEFKNNEASDLDQLNAILATMALDDLDLEDAGGYLATTRKADGTIVERRYGLRRGTLVCEQEKGGCHYQIDTAVVDQALGIDYQQFHEIWCEEHPDRVMRMQQSIGFEDNKVIAFIVLHHERISE